MSPVVSLRSYSDGEDRHFFGRLCVLAGPVVLIFH
jgi:hypothetical protein